jgi:hypothetical protein
LEEQVVDSGILNMGRMWEAPARTMVHHYFGSKDKLFAESHRLGGSPDTIGNENRSRFQMTELASHSCFLPREVAGA